MSWLQSIGPVRLSVALITLLASAASWVYRFIDEYSPYREIALYVLVPLVIWLLFVGPLLMTGSRRQWLRVLAWLLLIPASLLWGLSILVGINGLRIH